MTLADVTAISGNGFLQLSCRRATGTGNISWRYALDAAGLSGYTTITTGQTGPDYTWSGRTNDTATPFFIWADDGDGWVAAEFPGYAAASAFIDADGWRIPVASSDTVFTFVSQAHGSDANSGTSANAPLLTLRNVATYVPRDNYPDWLLLRRGDTWGSDQIRRGNSQWHGRSTTEPAVICAYGSGARPIITADAAMGYEGIYFWHPQLLHIYSIDVRHEVVGDAVNRVNGVFLNTPTDCSLEDVHAFDCGGNSAQGLDPGAPDGGVGNRLRIHRCQFLNSSQAASNGHSQGFFADLINELSITECVLDHNGWDLARTGHEPDQFNHNIYLTADCGPATITDCVIARASANGMQMRNAGHCERNLLLANPIGILFASSGAGEAGTVVNNVIIDSRDIDALNQRGWGIDLQNSTEATISGNLILHNSVPGVNTQCLMLTGPLSSVSITGNIVYRWGGPMVSATEASITTLTFTGNDLQYTGSLIASWNTAAGTVTFGNNRYHTTGASSSWAFLNGVTTSLSAWLADVGDTTSTATQVTSYPDPERNVADYLTSIGVTPGADPIDTFMTGARANRRGSWDSRYTNEAIDYFRAGFGLSALFGGGGAPAPSGGRATVSSLPRLPRIPVLG